MTDAPRETTTACPECDDTDIRQRLVEKYDSRSDPDAPRWVCEDCGVEFAQPVERERYSLGGRRGLAGQLADPDVGDPGDLVTDGGDPVASTGGGRHAPAMAGSTTPERTYAHYCDEVGSTVYAPRRRCPYECYRDDDVDRGDGVETDGGRPRRDQIVAAVLEGRQRPSDRLRESIRTDGGELPTPDRSEQERRARQSATSLVAWSRRAGVDPGVVLNSVREGLPRADGGYDGAGDGQCLALTNDGTQCTNGTYGSDDLCGIHKRADDVQMVVNRDGDDLS